MSRSPGPGVGAGRPGKPTAGPVGRSQVPSDLRIIRSPSRRRTSGEFKQFATDFQDDGGGNEGNSDSHRDFHPGLVKHRPQLRPNCRPRAARRHGASCSPADACHSASRCLAADERPSAPLSGQSVKVSQVFKAGAWETTASEVSRSQRAGRPPPTCSVRPPHGEAGGGRRTFPEIISPGELQRTMTWQALTDTLGRFCGQNNN